MDTGANSFAGDDTSYIDPSMVLALGLAHLVDWDDIRMISTAGGAAPANSSDNGARHTTFGTVKVHLLFDSFDPGVINFTILALPSTTHVLLGWEELERLRISVDSGRLDDHGNPAPALVMFKAVGKSEPVIDRPLRCAYKLARDQMLERMAAARAASEQGRWQQGRKPRQNGQRRSTTKPARRPSAGGGRVDIQSTKPEILLTDLSFDMNVTMGDVTVDAAEVVDDTTWKVGLDVIYHLARHMPA